jgi:hypothetical protein
MRTTVDVTDGKPIAVLLQSISGVSVSPLVAFYDIHGGKREVLFFYFVPDTTRDMKLFGLIFFGSLLLYISVSVMYVLQSKFIAGQKPLLTAKISQ